jgi:putative ABC transport system permease protein
VVGIGVGAATTRLANAIFRSGSGDEANQVLSVKPTSVLAGMTAGFFISMVTVFITSLLISRFNIILAIRDLPRPRTKRPVARRVTGSVMALFGVLLTLSGVAGKSPIASIIGPALLAFALIILLDRKLVTIVAS